MNYVSFYDALRFANWLNNGQGSGDTETGAYTLLGGTATPSNGATVTRNAGRHDLPPERGRVVQGGLLRRRLGELLRLSGGLEHADDVRARRPRRRTRPTATTPSGDLTTEGSYTGSASPYGTFDQGGNVCRVERGDHQRPESRRSAAGTSAAPRSPSPRRRGAAPARRSRANSIGFRLAMIPEPGTGLLVIAGLLGLAGWRRARA